MCPLTTPSRVPDKRMFRRSSFRSLVPSFTTSALAFSQSVVMRLVGWISPRIFWKWGYSLVSSFSNRKTTIRRPHSANGASIAVVEQTRIRKHECLGPYGRKSKGVVRIPKRMLNFQIGIFPLYFFWNNHPNRRFFLPPVRYLSSCFNRAPRFGEGEDWRVTHGLGGKITPWLSYWDIEALKYGVFDRPDVLRSNVGPISRQLVESTIPWT